MSNRPNILFLLTDDQRYDAISALGNPALKSPVLDALAASGTAFTHAHIPGGTSPAVCMPSRAMLHTGRGLFEIEGRGESMPGNHVLLAEHFRSHGYETFGTGKWHNGTPSYARSFSCGSEIFFGGMDDHWNVPACRFDPTGKYDVSHPIALDAFTSNRTRTQRFDHITPGCHSTDLFAEATRDFLRHRDAAKPFFAYVSFMAPHDPRSMPKRFRDLYLDDEIDLPPNFAAQHPFDTGALDVRDEMLASRPRQAAEIRTHIADYFAMITHLDEAIGRILADLDQLGLRERTIVVLAGDNGLALGQHGLMGKQSLYDHSVRVPLVISGPGVPQGERRDGLCLLADVFPSLCELSELPCPDSVTSPTLPWNSDTTGQRTHVPLAYCDTQRGVTTGNFKLIEYASGATQLFDLKADPWETANLSQLPCHQQQLHQLRRLLLEHRPQEISHPCGSAFWQARTDLFSPTEP